MTGVLLAACLFLGKLPVSHIALALEAANATARDHECCPSIGYHAEFCVTMYNEKVLNSVQTWLPGFSAMYHYTKFGMVSSYFLALHHYTTFGMLRFVCPKP